LLRDARDRGDTITALYPATLRPYRGLGYEVAGSYVTHEIALDDLPPDRAPLSVEPCDPDRDLEGIRACYREAVTPYTGPIDSEHPWWWKDRILGHWDPDQIHEVVVARGDRGIEGYMSFVHEPAPAALDIEFDLACKHFVASTPDGYRSLLAHARRFRGVGHALKFVSTPDEPATLLIDEQRLKPVSTFRWMFRLLNVASALEGRGYPDLSGEATIVVDDDRFPENRGPWRIAATDGKVEVTPAPSAPAASPVSIRALSAMFTGYLSPFDAVRLGLMEREDPAVPLLARLFAGPSPFMLDFF
jgi:predicted acetyltransferase